MFLDSAIMKVQLYLLKIIFKQTNIYYWIKK